MGTINWTRVILGGLVAGAIINAFEYLLNAIVLAKDWASVMTGLGKTGEMSGASIVLFNVLGLLAWHRSPLALRGDSPALRAWTEDRSLRRLSDLGCGHCPCRRYPACSRPLPNAPRIHGNGSGVR